MQTWFLATQILAQDARNARYHLLLSDIHFRGDKRQTRVPVRQRQTAKLYLTVEAFVDVAHLRGAAG
jgi:hypothetical protein